MSKTKIPSKVQFRLWRRAAGRCQYEGCNKPLWKDDLTQKEMNASYIAHIIGDSADGPRGDAVLSEKLKADLSNLMLLCDVHHRLVDDDTAGHPVERLQAMKRQHEERIELVTAISPDMKSHIILYGANVGELNSNLTWSKAAAAMLPSYYPAEGQSIELGLKNSSLCDHDGSYWNFERQQLHRQFHEKVKGRLQQGDLRHLSIFALAPQPLLIELGRLLSDILAAEVYQLHREPPDWRWQPHDENFEYVICEPADNQSTVVLNLSLSATITDDRISNVVGANVSIWKMTNSQVHNDFLQSREQLRSFRKHFRILLDRIKARHGQNTVLHIFPAVPVSIAVEIGRVWMPKADMVLRIYDQNRQTGGFSVAFDICQEVPQC